MLTYPDKQKFQQLRARWETADAVANNLPPNMAVRKERRSTKDTSNEPPNSHHSGVNFRRKLSHGLSLISNPLSQRRTTPGRQQPGNLSLTSPNSHHNSAATGEAFDQGTGVPYAPDLAISTVPAVITSDSSYIGDHHSSSTALRTDAAHKPALRSHTLSFLPRPSRSESCSTVTDSHGSNEPLQRVHLLESRAKNTPTKIPTPSPPYEGRKLASPRQYLLSHTARQSREIGAGTAFATSGCQSPSKNSPTRSHTTPNLFKTRPYKQPFVTRRKSPRQTKRRPSDSINQSLTLKENAPMAGRGNQAKAQLHGNEQRRPSLGSRTVMDRKRSLIPQYSPVESKEDYPARQVKDPRRIHETSTTQTLSTAQIKAIDRADGHQVNKSSSKSNSISIAQARLMGPVNPPTPKPSERSGNEISFERSNTRSKHDIEATGTLHAERSGVRMQSRSARNASSKVRLPRSSTFHSVRWLQEDIPPVPPIPERFRNLTQPDLASLAGTSKASPSLTPPRSLLRKPSPCDPSIAKPLVTNTSSIFAHEPEGNGSDSELNEAAPLGVPSNVSVQSGSQTDSLHSHSSVHEENADIVDTTQIRDYMAPEFWAGRLSTRLDFWRTEAMKAELNPSAAADGAMGLTLDQDKTALNLIFIQLRNTCATQQAVDSLWAFEFKYRRDHKLPGPMASGPRSSMRKQHGIETPKQGGFSRAVRKLTPRKNSLMNLLKGKGWNREDEHISTVGHIEQEVTKAAKADKSMEIF